MTLEQVPSSGENISDLPLPAHGREHTLQTPPKIRDALLHQYDEEKYQEHVRFASVG